MYQTFAWILHPNNQSQRPQIETFSTWNIIGPCNHVTSQCKLGPAIITWVYCRDCASGVSVNTVFLPNDTLKPRTVRSGTHCWRPGLHTLALQVQTQTCIANTWPNLETSHRLPFLFLSFLYFCFSLFFGKTFYDGLSVLTVRFQLFSVTYIQRIQDNSILEFHTFKNTLTFQRNRRHHLCSIIVDN